jgi:flagellar protein FlaG
MPIITEQFQHKNSGVERKPVEKVIHYPDATREGYKYNKEDLEKAVEQSNRLFFNQDNHFEFKVHEGTGRMMVKLVNKETKEVIKEIPPEKILDLIANIWDLVGILVDERG